MGTFGERKRERKGERDSFVLYTGYLLSIVKIKREVERKRLREKKERGKREEIERKERVKRGRERNRESTREGERKERK